MFRGDCHIDVHMIFPIRRTFPRLAVVAADENVERCGSEPFACIAFLYFCSPCLLPDYDEIPGLEVDCRWSHTSGFQDICQFLVFHRGGCVLAYRTTFLGQFSQVHNSVSILYLFRLGESLEISSPMNPARNICVPRIMAVSET